MIKDWLSWMTSDTHHQASGAVVFFTAVFLFLFYTFPAFS
jgi:hypothetical protein